MIIFQKPHFCNKTEKFQKLFSFVISLTAYVFGGFNFLLEKNFQNRLYKIPKRDYE